MPSSGGFHNWVVSFVTKDACGSTSWGALAFWYALRADIARAIISCGSSFLPSKQCFFDLAIFHEQSLQASPLYHCDGWWWNPVANLLSHCKEFICWVRGDWNQSNDISSQLKIPRFAVSIYSLVASWAHRDTCYATFLQLLCHGQDVIQ